MARVALLLCLALCASGCCLVDAIFPIGAVDVDSSKIGTGEPAFVPRDDLDYYHGEPSNLRRKH